MLQRDPAGRTCPDCREELNEIIPLDSNGTCHGCGACYGKVKDVAKTFGRLGGQATSEAKAAAARENGRLGGRPKEKK
jgi:hypothetical protein